MNRNTVLLFIILLVAFASCKTSRSISKDKLPPNPVEELVALVQKAQPQFTTANVSKMSLALDMLDRKVNVSASCKFYKDSAMHISIQPFMGIEMFKAELNPDSIIVFDKMNRRYYVINYSYFSERFGVDIDFYSLQALISNRFFCVGKKEVSPEECTAVVSTNKSPVLGYETQSMKQQTQLTTDYRIQQVALEAKNIDYILQATYSNFETIGTVNFPLKIALIATGEKNKMTCDFSILKVDFDTDIKFSSNSTERYTKGNIDNLLKK